VLAVVDLRVRLGLPAAALSSTSRIVAVAARERRVGLLVDAEQQVVKLLPSAVEPPPADVMTPRSEYIAGVYHWGEALLVLLDAERVLRLDEAVAATS
jgi:purine-binding chemotaxis protein CheW